MTTTPADPSANNNTPTRPIRVPLDLWGEFGIVATQLGSNRTALILEYMRWMTRQQGAKLPKRPDTPPAATAS
jgi:hypothetical protein